MQHLLLVDDEAEIVDALSRVFNRDYKVSKFVDPELALAMLRDRDNDIDLVIADIQMPKLNGLELLMSTKDFDPDIGRVLISGYSDVETCEQAIEDGIASVIITKPWDNFELKNIIKLILRCCDLHKKNKGLQRAITELHANGEAR